MNSRTPTNSWDEQKGSSAQKPSTGKRLIKAGVLLSVFISAFTVAGGAGTLIALALLGLWLFLDIQDSMAGETGIQPIPSKVETSRTALKESK